MTIIAQRLAPPVLDLGLDTRLALVDAAMTVRLDEAAVAFEVNTAHLPGADPIPHIAEAVPLPLAPTLPSPYSTPVADLLHRARGRLAADGWCRDNLYDDQGAICPVRAIRLEAHGALDLADDACVLLLETIRQHFPDAETIPNWNASLTSATPVLAAFGRAAAVAHTRRK